MGYADRSLVDAGIDLYLPVELTRRARAMTDRDEWAIVRVLNLYALVMDTQRWDLFDEIFTSDVDADFGESTHWRNLESFKTDFAAYHASFDATQHIMLNPLVAVSGDTAHAFTYGSWRLMRKGMEGGDFWEGGGWYDDTLVRTAAGWRIRKRTCRVAWWGGNPLVNQPSPDTRFDLRSSSLKAEAQAGRVAFVNHVCPPKR